METSTLDLTAVWNKLSLLEFLLSINSVTPLGSEDETASGIHHVDDTPGS